MKHEIKEIVKIILCNKKTGEILMECKPTTQPITMNITSGNENSNLTFSQNSDIIYM